jgi:hypothetical protein
LRLEGRDDVLEVGVLVRLCSFLGQSEPHVLAFRVDEPGDQPRDVVAQEPIERRSDERIDASFEVDRERRRNRDPIEHPAAGIRWWRTRSWAGGIGRDTVLPHRLARWRVALMPGMKK